MRLHKTFWWFDATGSTLPSNPLKINNIHNENLFSDEDESISLTENDKNGISNGTHFHQTYTSLLTLFNIIAKNIGVAFEIQSEEVISLNPREIESIDNHI